MLFMGRMKELVFGVSYEAARTSFTCDRRDAQ